MGWALFGETSVHIHFFNEQEDYYVLWAPFSSVTFFWLSFYFRIYLMIITVPVSRATLEETVRWRLMSVCLVLVRMEGHVLTLLMGTTATAAVSFR